MFVKRTLLALVVAVFGIVLMVGVEIVLALRREYLPTEPALVIEGTYGNGTPLRFAVLGDSTAAGLGTDEANSYPTVLAKRLAEDGYRVELKSFGISGATVGSMLDEQVPAAEEMRPHLVFIGIGANDATHLTRISSLTRDMTEAVERMKATGAEVVVAGAPDMRAEAFHEPLRSLAGWRGSRVADAIAEVARANDVPLVPLAEITGRFFDQSPEDHYAADRFHPNGRGYARWADAIYPYLVEALG